jgi:PAS domain S-box-containing protein
MLSAVVAVVGLLLSVAGGAALARGQREAAGQQLERRATLVAQAVAAETGRYVDALRTVAAAAGAFQPLTAATFAEATRPLADMRLAGATSIAYLVPARDSEIASVQALWRTRGVPDLTLRPVGEAREHIFSVLSQPLDGTNIPRYGIDVVRSAAPTQALDASRRTGRSTVSDPYQLLIDQALPPAQRQMSFSLTAPVYAAPDATGHRAFRGWVLMGIRGWDLIGATLTRASQNLLDVTLRAPRADGTYPVVATQRASVTGDRDLSRSAEITVADRHWRLQVQAAGRSLPGGTTGMPTVATGSGVVLALLLAGLVYTLATGRARAQAQVQTATTELAAAEPAARQQADLLTAIMDTLSEGVGVVDTDGQFLLHNPAAKAILGLTEDVAGAENWQRHYGMFRADGQTEFPAEEMPLARGLAGEPTDHVEMVIRNAAHPDGIAISVSGRPLHGAGGHIGAVAVFHDITARKTAEAELRAAGHALADQQAYLTQVLDAIDVTVITCDTTGAIVHANRAARRTLPADESEHSIAAATPAVRLAHPDGTLVAVDDTPLARALRGEHVDGMEAVLPLPDGTHRALMLHARPLHDATGALIGAVAASYNVTALREREADLRAFAGVAAHDLKAPLTAVAGFAELLDEDLPETIDPAVRHSLGRIRAGVDRMRRLIDDLLSYATARDKTLHLQTVDLQELVADVIAERTAHLRGATDPDGQPTLFPDIYTGPLPVVHADKAMTRQLLDNLVGNALKYTLPGQPARLDIAASHDDDQHVRIQIADRGIGIPDTDKPHVFASFRRADNHGNRPGTGLGLAICQRIIDRHGGTIDVTDNPGGGTRITFTLPTTGATAGTSTTTVEPANPGHTADR